MIYHEPYKFLCICSTFQVDVIGILNAFSYVHMYIYTYIVCACSYNRVQCYVIYLTIFLIVDSNRYHVNISLKHSHYNMNCALLRTFGYLHPAHVHIHYNNRVTSSIHTKPQNCSVYKFVVTISIIMSRVCN